MVVVFTEDFRIHRHPIIFAILYNSDRNILNEDIIVVVLKNFFE